MSHQGLFDFAQDEFEILDDDAEGHWGGILKMPSLTLLRESHGFDEEIDKETFDKFTDYLADKYL